MKILIVDDSPDAADTVAGYLRSRGHSVMVCYDAKTAMELAEQEELYCALVDLRMPIVDGMSLSRQLRDRFGSRLVIVGMTGDKQLDILTNPRMAALDDCLLKPVPLAVWDRLFGDA